MCIEKCVKSQISSNKKQRNIAMRQFNYGEMHYLLSHITKTIIEHEIRVASKRLMYKEKIPVNEMLMKVACVVCTNMEFLKQTTTEIMMTMIIKLFILLWSIISIKFN